MAYFYGGTNFGPYRPNPNSLKYIFKDKYFNSVENIFAYYNNDMKSDNFGDTVLTFDNPPITCVKYPQQQNMEWLFTIVQTTKFKKKYTDYETVNVTAGNFNV